MALIKAQRLVYGNPGLKMSKGEVENWAHKDYEGTDASHDNPNCLPPGSHTESPDSPGEVKLDEYSS
jgi:hypothetical protein